MFEFLSQFFTQIQANFKVLPLGRKILLVMVALGTILGIVLLVVWTNRISYQPLYFNLSPEDAGTVIEELKDQKIPHRLSANGRTVMVPAGKIYDLRQDSIRLNLSLSLQAIVTPNLSWLETTKGKFLKPLW